MNEKFVVERERERESTKICCKVKVRKIRKLAVSNVKRSVKRFIFCLVQERWQKNKKVGKVRWRSRNLLAT